MQKKTKDLPSIVIATDVRFWHGGTGAERRILTMVQYLERYGFNTTTIFVAPLRLGSFHATEERQAIREQGLRVYSLIEDWQPNGLLNKLIYKIQCVANLFKIKPAKNVGSSKPSSGSCYLKDFENPLMKFRFHEMLKRFRPDIVLCQYVTMSFLVGESKQDQPAWVVDTHDCLSSRYEQFRQRGLDHWIRISQQEELDAINKFDLAIAIQAEEAETFQSAGQDREGFPNVIVAGHPSQTDQPSSVKQTLTAKFDLGYFGSDNPSNLDAVEWFLKEVWPNVLSRRPKTSLLIAGTICRVIPEQLQSTDGVVFQSEVDSLSKLYHSFAVAVNPVRFGTGLKIKNQEALAYGKPLVVTPVGAEGMIPAEVGQPYFVANTTEQMTAAVLNLLENKKDLMQSAQSALEYARRQLSADSIYGDLVQKLIEAK